MVLVTVYSKTEQADVAPEDIRQIILDLESSVVPDVAPEQKANGAEPDNAADRPAE